MISSELPEVLRVADRILVMREGRLVAEFDHARRLRGDDRRGRDRADEQRRRVSAAVDDDRAGRAARAADARSGSSTSSSGSASSGSSRVLAPARRDHAIIQSRFLSTQELPVRPPEHGRLRAARDRRDDGHPHPERRSLGRLGARALGLPVGQPVRPAPGHPDRRRLPRRARHRRRLRDRQRAPRRRSAACRASSSRSRRSTSSAASTSLIVGGGQVVASSLPNAFLNIPQATIVGDPRPRDRGRGRASPSSPTTCARSARAASCTRSARTPTPRGSPGIPIGAAGLHGVRRSAARSPGSPACSGPPSTARSTRRPAPATSCRSIAAVVVGGVAIFGGSGSVVGAALGALLLNTINSALYVLGISSFWDQAIAGLLLLARDHARPGDQLQLTAALRRRSRLGA